MTYGLMLNYSCPEFQLLIGDLDVTRAVVELSVAQSRIEAKNPITWTGTMRLAANLLPTYQIAESLDNFVNPGRWSKAAHPVLLYLQGQKILTLRIKSYTYNPDQQTAEATLVDLLGLLNDSVGGKPLTSIEISKPTVVRNIVDGEETITTQKGSQPWTNIVSAIAEESSPKRRIGSTPLVTRSQVVTPSSTGTVASFSTLPQISPRAASQIAQISQVSTQTWPWVDKDELIRFVKYPQPGTTSPKYRLARTEVDDYIRVTPEQAESNTVEVSANSTETKEPARKVDRKKLAPQNQFDETDEDEQKLEIPLSSTITYPIVIESPAPVSKEPLISRQTIYEPLILGNRVLRYETTYARIDSIIPGNSSTNYIISEEVWTKETYDFFDGKLIAREITKTEPLAKIAPEAFENNYGRVVSEKSAEVWEYDETGVASRSKLTQKPIGVIFNDADLGTGIIPAEREEETWTALSSEITGSKYQHQTLFYKTKGELYPSEYEANTILVLDIKKIQPPEFVSAKPKPEYREVPEPIAIRISKSRKAKTESTVGDDDDTLDEPRKYSFEYAPDDAQLDALASVLLDIIRQRAGNRQISHPVRLADLFAFEPLQIVDVHDGRFVRDEFSLHISRGDKGYELACAYSGLLQGVLPTPVQRQVNSVGEGQNVVLPKDGQITPVVLTHDSSATVTAVSLPPGLALSGRTLIGAPTASGTGQVQITTGTGSQYLNFSVTVALPPIAVSTYRKSTSATDGADYPIRMSVWTLGIFVPPLAAESVTLRSGTVTAATPTSGTPYAIWSERIGNAQISPAYLGDFVGRTTENQPWGIGHFVLAQIESWRPLLNWLPTPLYAIVGRQTTAAWGLQDLGIFIYRETKGTAYPLRVFAVAPPVERIGIATTAEVIPQTARGRFFTPTSSSWYTTAYFSSLTDLQGTTVGMSYGVSSPSSPQWIMVDFGGAVVIESVLLGGGSTYSYPSGVPQSIASNLNACTLQYSNDGINWIHGFIPAGITDSGTSQFVRFSLAVTARFFRIVTATIGTCAATSEFSFL